MSLSGKSDIIIDCFILYVIDKKFNIRSCNKRLTRSLNDNSFYRVIFFSNCKLFVQLCNYILIKSIHCFRSVYCNISNIVLDIKIYKIGLNLFTGIVLFFKHGFFDFVPF
jgi:hypothetical protein